MSSSGQVTLRMIIPGKEIGVIIGKGGETINNIRQDCGAKIFITDASVPERVITVTGTEQAVSEGYELMCCKLEAGEDGNQTKNLNLRLIVPAAQCGSIIGKGGSKVKEIRDTTHASINVAQDLLPGSNERCVAVSGARSKCVQAINLIITIIANKPAPGSVVQYKPNFGPAGYPGAVPPMDGRRGGPDPRMGMAMGGPPMPNNPLAALAMTARNHMSSRRAGSSGEEASHNMTISNDLIGVIIGKGGSKIAEIRLMSGAIIQISKNEKGDEGEDSTKDRSITITGSPESVTLAKNLINMTLELHQLDRHEDEEDRGNYRRYDQNVRYDRGGGPGGAPGPQHEELMKAINTITQFGMGAAANYMGGPPQGGYGGGAGGYGGGAGGGYGNGMRGGGRPQNGNAARGGRDDRNGGGNAGAMRTKFSPY